MPDALFLDLLQPDVARELAARPERLRDMVRGAPERSTVVIDEVQRVPDLLSVVHVLIESKDKRRFVLTGSSARKLRRGGTDLLAGRAVVRTLHPFMASELDRFDFRAALTHGLLPLVVAADQPDDVLRAYASLYLDAAPAFGRSRSRTPRGCVWRISAALNRSAPTTPRPN